MYRILQYSILFAVVSLLQIFLFNNLMISAFFSPLIYVAFLLLLPIETPPIVMLLLGLLSGVAMDWTMGAAGVNTAATVFVAFFRLQLLGMLLGRENVHDGGVPSALRMGDKLFFEYTVCFVALHHAIFFAMESLSLAHLWLTGLRWAVSVAASVVCCWLIARLFALKLTRA